MSRVGKRPHNAHGECRDSHLYAARDTAYIGAPLSPQHVCTPPDPPRAMRRVCYPSKACMQATLTHAQHSFCLSFRQMRVVLVTLCAAAQAEVSIRVLWTAFDARRLSRIGSACHPTHAHAPNTGVLHAGVRPLLLGRMRRVLLSWVSVSVQRRQLLRQRLHHRDRGARPRVVGDLPHHCWLSQCGGGAP